MHRGAASSWASTSEKISAGRATRIGRECSLLRDEEAIAQLSLKVEISKSMDLNATSKFSRGKPRVPSQDKITVPLCLGVRGPGIAESRSVVSRVAS